MSTVSQNSVTISMEPTHWRLAKSLGSGEPGDEGKGTLEVLIDHHFGKDDDFTIYFYRNGERFTLYPTREEVEALEREAEEHGEVFDPAGRHFSVRDMQTISGSIIQPVLDDILARWSALKLLVTPDIATRD